MSHHTKFSINGRLSLWGSVLKTIILNETPARNFPADTIPSNIMLQAMGEGTVLKPASFPQH